MAPAPPHTPTPSWTLRRPRSWWPWAALACGLGVTLAAWLQMRKVVQDQYEVLQQAQSQDAGNLLGGRLRHLEQVLQISAVHLGRREGLPSPEERRDCVAALDLPGASPGVLGLTYIAWYPAGTPGQAGAPLGTPSPHGEGYSAIVLGEPSSPDTRAALGKDPLADAPRRKALLRARDTGRPVLTGKVALLPGADGRPREGVVLVGPVYRPGSPLGTVLERRQALRGWTAFPIGLQALVQGIIPPKLQEGEIRLVDATEPEAEAVLYATGPAAAAQGGGVAFEAAGRTWSVKVLPRWWSPGSRGAWEVLAAGLAGSLLVFGLMRGLAQAEARAQRRLARREADLLAAEGRYQAVFARSPLGMTISNARTGRYLSVNPRMAEILGYSVADLEQRTYMSVTHPDELLGDAEAMAALEPGARRGFTREKRYLHAGGREVWARLTVVPLPGTTWEDPRTLALVEDITEVRRAQEALLASEARFRSMFEKAPLGMAVTDLATGRYLSVNPRLGEILGCAPEDLVGRTYLGVTHPDDLPAEMARLDALAGALPGEVLLEKRYLREDGGTVWARVRTVPLAPREGEAPAALALVEDITAARAAEEALRASEARFRSIFSLTPDGLSITRLRDGALLEVNPSWERKFACPRGEAVGRSLGDLGLEPAPARPAPPVHGPRGPGRAGPLGATLRSRQGRTFQADIRGAELVLEGEPALLTVVRDTTAEWEARERVERLSARYATLLETTQDALHVLDAEGRLWEWNPAFLAHLGYTEEEAGSLWVQDWDARWSPEELPALLRSNLASPSTFETLHRRKDGSLRAVEVSIGPVLLDGEPMALASARDITDRKATEEALRVSEARFRAVVQESPLPTILHQDGKVLFVNPAAVALFRGSAAEDLVGRPVLDLVHPDDREAVQRRVAALLAEGLAAPLSAERFLALDGGVVAVRVQARPTLLDGRPAAVVFAEASAEGWLPGW